MTWKSPNQDGDVLRESDPVITMLHALLVLICKFAYASNTIGPTFQAC